MHREQDSKRTGDRPGWDGLLFLLTAAIALFARFRTPTLLLASYQDDFFYYLKIAQNLALTGTSTFNSLTSTNGYHPLWMLVLTVLAIPFQGIGFFVALQVVSLVAALCFFVYLRRTLRLLTTENLAGPASLVLGLLAVLLIRYGMEVTLALPLGMYLLYRLANDGLPADSRHAATLGLAAAALVLARLDAAILVALLCLAALPELALKKPTLARPSLARPSLAKSGRRPGTAARLATFLSCLLLPIGLYIAINWHVFHLLMPVSGLAKQMRTSHLPAARAYETLLPFDRQRLILILPQSLLLLTALFWPSDRDHRLRSRVFRAFVVFPFVHWFTLGILSDWPTWPWYTYSLTLGCAGALALLLERRTTAPAPLAVRLPFYVYAAALGVYIAGYAVLGPDSVSLVRSSRQVARFMDAHPAIYLMGDQSGTTAYLSHQPIVQTEGLVMDRAFLQRMRARTPLAAIAQQYHARYYVAVGQYQVGTCLVVREPGNGGRTSPTMDGRICHAALATWYRDGVPIRVFDTAWIEPLTP